ncbi:hypothetical protein OIU74_010949 [Salix koriyanagi]|uniref:Uncharacterized protein n=1 Tax=Salix koriyanagi TaxID=2511006 RepID=A0A9Q0TE34_9ROSI|nr:hypothetical protein OIU74_010949 [Salix koriyanagi]
MEEEAVGCYEVLAEGEVLGIPSTSFDCACNSSYSSRQGSPFGIQGKTGVCCLSYPCEAWWQERGPFRRVLFMASQQTRVLPSLSSSVARGQLLKSVQGGN